MKTWLHTFGTYDPVSQDPQNTSGYDYVLKTSDKSLVVSFNISYLLMRIRTRS